MKGLQEENERLKGILHFKVRRVCMWLRSAGDLRVKTEQVANLRNENTSNVSPS